MTTRNRRKADPKWGVPVTDAKRDLTITVKASDIRNAKVKDKSSCAAANALCRQEHFKKALVGKSTTYVQKRDGTWLRYRTPGDLYTEIMVFDRGGKMDAGDFILKAPTGSSRLGHHAKPRGPHKKSGLPRKHHIIDNVRPDTPRGISALRKLLDA